jgi:threonine/homoserine/homoserine lactone efflux protein
METVLRNIALGVSLAAPIGPSGITVMQNGLRHGFLRAYLTGLGVTMADATYLLLVFFGLSRFLQIMVIKTLIWSLGALALLYFGYRSIRDARGPVDLDGTVVITARSPLLVGYVVNVSNPIAIVWWLGVFGSLLSETVAGGSRIHALVVSSTILIGILLWHSTMSLLTQWGKRFLNERTARLICVAAGMALVLFGLWFAYNGFLTAVGG